MHVNVYRLFCGLALLLALTACNEPGPSAANPTTIREVKPDQAVPLVNAGAVLIDVRSDREWQDGHLWAARHLPIDALEQNKVELDLTRNTPILLHCKSGGRAGRAARMLEQQGFSDITVVKDGGFAQLRDAGLTQAPQKQ